MDQAVANAGFMDASRLGVADIECLIAAVAVSAGCQIIMQCDNIIHEAQLEYSYVFPIALANNKFLPGFQYITKTNNIIKRMAQTDFSVHNDSSFNHPPPNGKFIDS